MNILTLKVGDRYDSRYVNRLYRGLKRNSTIDFDFYCYTEDPTNLDQNIHVIPLVERDDVQKQWYKIDFHHMPWLQGKCIILDIDYLVISNVDDILGWDLLPKHFGCNYRWWSILTKFCEINGGFQMFNQGDTKHLYDIFYSDPEYWQQYYIQKMHTEPPVNGEQNFVDHHCQCDRSWLPQEWFAKYHLEELSKIQEMWHERVNKTDPYFMGGEFNEQIKMVHFSNSNNMIHESDEDWIAEYWYD
mgnify:CR=1 FL=1